MQQSKIAVPYSFCTMITVHSNNIDFESKFELSVSSRKMGFSRFPEKTVQEIDNYSRDKLSKIHDKMTFRGHLYAE